MNKFGINVLLTVVVAAAGTEIVRKYSPTAWGTLELAGLVLCVVGFVFWTIARFQLGASLTVTAQARKLVSRGLYSRIRNPIYVFGSMFIAGLILAVGRPVFLLVFLIIVPLQVWRAHIEARTLAASFGDQYVTYRQQTWF